MNQDKDAELRRVIGKLRNLKLKRFTPLFFLTIFSLVIAFIMSMTSSKMMRNVESRATADIQTTVSMQSAAFKEHIDDQFQALRLVADMLSDGRHFGSEKFNPTLNSIVRTYRLCTLCLADTNGNTTDYNGNVLGSCSDREYFREIMDGSLTQVCEYIAETKKTGEPRVILSIPAYDEYGDMLGVLFASKEIEVLEDSLFENNALFDTTSAIYICDESGQIIVTNDNGDDFFREHNINANGALNVNSLGDGLQTIKEDGKAKHIVINGAHCFAGYAKLDECGWSLYCLVDEDSAGLTYSENLDRMRNTIASVILIFAGCIAVMYALGLFYMRQKEREAIIIKQYNDNYKNILSETHCAVLEYDTDTGTVSTIQENFGDLKLGSINGKLDAYEEYKHKHPEFDFEELESEIDIVMKNGRTCSFESILEPDPGRFYWLKTKLIPISDENGEIRHVYCVLFDVSDMHYEHEKALDTYAQIPGAVQRHILTKPIHLNYYSDGLCKMLGYTRAEIEDIVGPKQMYSELIYTEDRLKYIDFLTQIIKDGGGTGSCEYRLQCKNGELLEVSDTMDAKKGSSGIMYGYSVVTDLSKYREEQQQLELELRKTKEQLSQSRIKNATSQMQPHFLYNALSSIREIVLEDPEYASDLIYDFTTHLRACVRSMSSDALVSFTQELENIKAYVNIEKMRFGDRLNVEYDCPVTDFDIIPLSIQPLVENAVRHGVFDRGTVGGKVRVSTARGDGSILVYVEDNGVGFDYEKTMQEIKTGTRDSNGLANLIFRFATLMRAEVSVDSEIGSGTKVTVTIPVGGAKDSENHNVRC